MSVSVTLIQTRSVVNNKYRVDNSVPASTGISPKIFVMVESTYTYDRVASLDDMLNVPDAPDPTHGYYRDSAFHRDFVDVSDAANFSDGVKERINSLVGLYDVAENDFSGSETTVFTSNI